MGTPAIPVAGTTMVYVVMTGLGMSSELCMIGYSLVLAMNYLPGMAVITLNVIGDAATNVIAIICIAVVPFMLIVIPVGRTKLLISFEHPSSSVHVFVFSGSVAAEEFVAAANKPIFNVFFTNGIGFSRVVRNIPTG